MELVQIADLRVPEKSGWFTRSLLSIEASSSLGRVIVLTASGRTAFLHDVLCDTVRLYTIPETGNSNETITAVKLLPEYSTTRCNLPWPCAAIGYNTGVLRIYVLFNGQMRMLLCVRLHTTECLSLRCRVTSGVKPIITDLYTLHSGGVVVSLEGPALFRALYAAADGLGMCEDTVEYKPAQHNADEHESEDKHLAFHKWILKDQGRVNDVFFLGPHARASASLSTASPVEKRFIAIGRNPFISYYTTTDAPTIADLALTVYRALGRALSTAGGLLRAGLRWVGGKAPQHQEATPRDDDPTGISVSNGVSLGSVRGLGDAGRDGVYVCGDEGIHADRFLVADTLGRVFLVDGAHFVVLRIWKGYRDAVCGFHGCPGPASAATQLSPILYLPRRGIVEAWEPLGDKKGSLKIGGDCKLQSCSWQGRCRCFILSPDGVLSEIQLRPNELSEHLLATNRQRDASRHEPSKLRQIPIPDRPRKWKDADAPDERDKKGKEQEDGFIENSPADEQQDDNKMQKMTVNKTKNESMDENEDSSSLDEIDRFNAERKKIIGEDLFSFDSFTDSADLN